MSSEAKIFVDAAQPAVLRYAGACVAFDSLRLAIAAWRKLPTDTRQSATIALADGTFYACAQIPALYDRRLAPRAPAPALDASIGA